MVTQPSKLGSSCWEKKLCKRAMRSLVRASYTLFKLQLLSSALAWATLEVCLCLALIPTCWHDFRPASSPGTYLGYDWPWLPLLDLSCSPCPGTVGLSPCWCGYSPATLLVPFLLTRLSWGAARSCCFLRRWTLNSCTYTAIDSRHKWKSMCCWFWKTKMKKCVLQDHSYLILNLVRMEKIIFGGGVLLFIFFSVLLHRNLLFTKSL